MFTHREEEEGHFVAHEPCEKCGSSDAKAVYSTGSAYCFACQSYFPSEDSHKKGRSYKPMTLDTPLLDIQTVAAITSRRISSETAEKFGYGMGLMNGQPVQIAPYFNSSRQLIAQHIRTADKDFRWRGNSKGHLELFGQHLWRKNGKRLVITEGEIDCMSIAQVFNNKWATVSIPNGANSALKYVKYNLEFIEGYEEIVIAFDNDDPGKKAAQEVAEILTAGKVKIANFHPFKDANEMLQKGKSSKIAQVIFEAKEYRPDGILAGTDVTYDELFNEDEVFSYDMPYLKLNSMLKGIRKGEITTLTSGTGMGKSTLAKELGYHLFKNHNQKIATIALEENVKKTIKSWIAIANNVPTGDFMLDPNLIPEDKRRATLENVIHSGRLFFYDHFGSLEATNLLAKIKFFAAGAEVDFIIFDHISIAVSGIEGGDERRLIDNLMTNLRSIVEATGVGVILISHLKNPSNNQKSHEEGGRVTANQLRGSGAIKHISDNIIGVERDQQSEDPDVSTLRVLKNRLIGVTGWAGNMKYSHKTGRLTNHMEEGLPPEANDDFNNPFLPINNNEESEKDNDNSTPSEISNEEIQEQETERPSGDSESDVSNNNDDITEDNDGTDREKNTYPTPY